MDLDFDNLRADTVQVVLAYIEARGSGISRDEVMAMIGATAEALQKIGQAPEPVVETPALNQPTSREIARSITDDHLISFEDGKPYKTLKRHLTTRGLTPETYRAKWGLPVYYPMVCSSYAKARSELAKQMGLGRGGRPATGR